MPAGFTNRPADPVSTSLLSWRGARPEPCRRRGRTGSVDPYRAASEWQGSTRLEPQRTGVPRFRRRCGAAQCELVVISPHRFPRITFTTICMGRLHHLKETLPQNLADNRDYPNLEFLLLNYGGRDGLDEWVRTEMKEHLESGRLVYYHSPEQQRFSLRSREEYGDASGDRRVAVQRRRGQQDRSPFRLSCRAAAAGV